MGQDRCRERRVRIIAFDSDALIYAAAPDNPSGKRILDVIAAKANRGKLIGSTLLLPELFIKPIRQQNREEEERLEFLISYLRLIDANFRICSFARAYGAKYGLKTPDAIHLTTAIEAGARTFITNNRKDFKASLIKSFHTSPKAVRDENPHRRIR